MKISRFVLIAAALSCAPLWAAAQQQVPGGGCKAKEEAITRDIEHAKDRNQKQRVRGLEKALKEVKANCSDAKLLAEHNRRIAQQEKKVAERERDLANAEREGSPDKVARRKAKLAEEQAELQRMR